MAPTRASAAVSLSVSITRQFLVFVAVGVASAIVDMSVMQGLLVQATSLWIAVAAGFAAGLMVNYVAHARYTFQSKITWRSGARFAAIVVFNYMMTLAFVHAAQVLVGSPLAGKVASLPFVAVTGFVVSRTWVFK